MVPIEPANARRKRTVATDLRKRIETQRVETTAIAVQTDLDTVVIAEDTTQRVRDHLSAFELFDPIQYAIPQPASFNGIQFIKKIR